METPASPLTACKRPVTPGVMRCGLPMYITENGLSSNDRIYLDGKVHDVERIGFLNRYLLELSKGIADGAPVHGYLQWSFLDNFEWDQGYDERFGLIYVDFVPVSGRPRTPTPGTPMLSKPTENVCKRRIDDETF